MSAFAAGDRVRFRHSHYQIKPEDDYVVCPVPEQRGAHLLTWVRKVAVGQLSTPLGVEAMRLVRAGGR